MVTRKIAVNSFFSHCCLCLLNGFILNKTHTLGKFCMNQACFDVVLFSSSTEEMAVLFLVQSQLNCHFHQA